MIIKQEEEHNLKKGDLIKVDSNNLFTYKINDVLVWKGETILSVTPIENVFSDCNSLILTRYNKIYKRWNKMEELKTYGKINPIKKGLKNLKMKKGYVTIRKETDLTNMDKSEEEN